MSDQFQDGEISSSRKFLAVLAEMQATGQQVLDDLEKTRSQTLFRFEQGLGALNSRRQRALRVLSPDIACKFVTADLLDIDPARTSATIRADSGSAVLRQRNHQSEASVRSTVFSSDAGSVETLNRMYRVHMPDGGAPTGRFDLQLSQEAAVSLVVLDMVMLPSDPSVRVLLSADGVSWNEADSVSRNGYRINAWCQSQPVRYLRVLVHPTHPDTLGGTTFTFGMTDVRVLAVDHYLYSELCTRGVPFVPVTGQLRFMADPGLEYYLGFGESQLFKVAPGEVVAVPGIQTVTADTQINPEWRLCAGGNPLQLPADIYPSSLKVLDVDNNRPVRLAWGLDPQLVGPNLASEYAAVKPYIDFGYLDRVPVNQAVYSDESGRTFRVTYAHGPQELTVRLQVRFLAHEHQVTPVFAGAYLEHVYNY